MSDGQPDRDMRNLPADATPPQQPADASSNPERADAERRNAASADRPPEESPLQQWLHSAAYGQGMQALSRLFLEWARKSRGKNEATQTGEQDSQNAQVERPHLAVAAPPELPKGVDSTLLTTHGNRKVPVRRADGPRPELPSERRTEVKQRVRRLTKVPRR